jgi:hypothetical protein
MELRRFKLTEYFRLTEFISNSRQRATGMPNGPQRDELLEKIRQAEADAKIEAWVNSLGLQPPK